MDAWRIYVREALTQLEFTKRCFAEFDRAKMSGNVESVFFELHHAVVHIANVDKLFNLKPGSKRALTLAGRVDCADIEFKEFRRLRNHLEHFDERLDKWIENFDGHAFFDMNIITNAKGFPEKAFLRALDGDIFKFYGEDFALADIRETVERLYQRLHALDVAQ